MTDKQEPELDDDDSGEEADIAEVKSRSPKQPVDEPDSNLLPRQIEDDQDATWFLTP